MTKLEFISQLDGHYANGRRLANVANQLIRQMVEKAGDMSFEYLYGEEDDEDADPDWCYLDDNFTLHDIYIENGEVIIRMTNEYNEPESLSLDKLNRDEIIEIADFLCRRN